MTTTGERMRAWRGAAILSYGFRPFFFGAGLLAVAIMAGWLLVLAIASNVAGLWLQQEMLQSLVSNTLSRSPLPPLAADVFGGFVTAARVMAGAHEVLHFAQHGERVVNVGERDLADVRAHRHPRAADRIDVVEHQAAEGLRAQVVGAAAHAHAPPYR